MRSIAFQRLLNGTALFAGIFLGASAFALPQVPTPNFSPAAGTYASAQSVTISSATPGASIAYTTDGTIPTESGGTITNGILYSGAISVSTTTLSALSFENGYADSAVAISGYTRQTAVSSGGGSSTSVPPGNLGSLPAITQTAAPTFSPYTGPQSPTFSLAPGTYASTQSVTISTSPGDVGLTIIYTTDGSTPTDNDGTPTGAGKSLVGGGTVSVNATMILKAVVTDGPDDSPVTSAIYTITSWPRAIVNVLYDFGLSGNAEKYPIAGLVQGTDGNFYGTTAGYSGTVETGVGSSAFQLTSADVFTPLVSFAGPNGLQPSGNLVQGIDGNFYGTTFSGGSTYVNGSNLGDGTVFKMTSTGTLNTLVSFTGANGSSPVAAMVQNSNGNFYGTTTLGGSNQLGTVFEVTTGGSLTTLVSFSGANGAAPGGTLVLGNDGNYYGTTDLGGSTFVSGSNVGDGTVFKMTPAGVLTTLVSFNGANGANPIGGLVQGTDGNFYGTTGEDGSINDGTVFKMTPAGSLTTLATFTGANGDQPSAGLVEGADGNFYGVTEQGGNNQGTIFRVSPTGGLTTLVSLDQVNGDDPGGNLIIGRDGNFYGTTIQGGASFNYGVIFQLIVPPGITGAIAPTFSLAPGSYTGAQTVAITTATAGASIIYTTNGTLPSESGGSIIHGTLYSGPVSISSASTIEAIAFKSGMFDSTATSGTYTISTPPPPTPAPASGGGGGAPSWWFLGCLSFAGILRWKLRKKDSIPT